jgi:BolA protein
MVIQKSIEKNLSDAFDLNYLAVENESHKHSVPPNSETHFKVTLVTDEFAGLRQVARHQKIYKVLADQMQAGVHALALHTYTVAEWQQAGNAPESPNCMGGSKKH